MKQQVLITRRKAQPDNGDATPEVRGGCMETIMNIQNLITTDALAAMMPAELEDYRSGGLDLRRELTHAVMRDLHSPDEWAMNGEYRSEFGGFFPVQVRFTPSHGRFQLAVCSAGDVSPVWMVVLTTASGRPFAVVRTMPAFNPDLINHVLNLVASLDADRYSPGSIINILSMEVPS